MEIRSVSIAIKVKKTNFLTVLISLILISIISAIVANRDLDSAGDTSIYAENFRSKLSLSDIRYEYLFDFITLLVRQLSDNPVYYFYVMNFILNITLLLTALIIAQRYKLKQEVFIPIFLCFMILSSWYLSIAFNGLRQGLALSLLYLGLCYQAFYNKKYLSILLIVTSGFFHYSNFLVVPFILFLRLKIQTLFFISIIIGIFYVLNINEQLVRVISNTLNISLYDSIKNYSEGTDAYRYGMQWDLFLYTIGLSTIYYFTNKLVLEDKITLIIKLYITLTLPYYIFGFAAFSNRYGVIAWLFSMFVNSAIFYNLIKNDKFLFSLLFVILLFGSLLYFLLRFPVL